MKDQLSFESGFGAPMPRAATEIGGAVYSKLLYDEERRHSPPALLSRNDESDVFKNKPKTDVGFPMLKNIGMNDRSPTLKLGGKLQNISGDG